MGTYDDMAHMRLLEAPATMRAEANRKADIARLLLTLTDAVWSDRIEMVQQRFGAVGTSKPSLKRILKAVEGIDPINFAPSMLQAYKGRTAKAAMSEDAWQVPDVYRPPSAL